jgi:hypothetical protein
MSNPLPGARQHAPNAVPLSLRAASLTFATLIVGVILFETAAVAAAILA